MARGRMISKCLSTSERYSALADKAGGLSEFCQSLYPLLVAHSDDFGRLQGDAFTVYHLVHPTSKRTIREFEVALTALHDVGLIKWYEVHGRKYIQISKFERHQSGLHKRTRSQFPAPSGKVQEIPAQLKGRELNGTEGKGTEERETRASELADGFSAFKAAYPSKEGWKVAEEVWGDLRPGPDLLAKILARVEEHKHSERWRQGPRWIPTPANWLRRGCWDDELPQDPAQALTEAKRSPWWKTCGHTPRCEHAAWHHVMLARDRGDV